MITYRLAALGLGLVLAAALVGQVATLPAATQDPDWHHLRGTYFATGTTSCIASGAGFNLNRTPMAGEFVYLQTSSAEGIWTFHADGTGTGQLTEVQVTLAMPVPPDLTGASKAEESFSFTYKITDDGALTITPGTVSGTFTSGTEVGDTFTVTIPALSGWIAKDGTAITLASTAVTLETVTVLMPSGGTEATIPQICNRTRVLIPVHED